MRHISGETREDYSFVNGAFTSERMAGGEQDFGGVFLESSQPLGRSIRATAGVRVDRWENDSGHMVESSIANGGVILDDLYPNRQGTELSPSAGLAWKASEAIELHVDGQRSFREPTLNELYRPFRQGSTTTLANPSLSTEHAESIEAGAALVRGQSRLTVEGFSTIIEDPVSNVTLAQGPGTFPLFGALPAGGAGQERLNLGRVDVRGAQLGYEWKGPGGLSLDLSLVDEETRVASAAVAPDLVGRRLPEVPRWSGSLALGWSPGAGILVDARIRSTSSEFDDDMNQLPLAASTVLDASLRIAVTRRADILVTGTNLGNSRIETAHSSAGVYNIATGRMLGLGARVAW
jgi:outer membrane receptor protein involved in Fe transport